MAFKRKKVTKYRGSKTHGGGAMKKRRGAGNRGGRGRAGSGKKGDAKKPSFWKEPVGKRGFKRQNAVSVFSINLFWIESSAESLIKSGKASMTGKSIVIDLKKLGYDKLLSKGAVTKAYDITVDSATPLAIEKVKKAGGTVTLKNKPEGE
ncbi:MAG: uL15m family ribosomal protein [Candidatus Woesearchaeota archaeon]